MVKRLGQGFGIVVLGLLMVGMKETEPRSAEEWTGFFYPYGQYDQPETGGPFRSKGDCLKWAKGKVHASTDEYRCGLNCRKLEDETVACQTMTE